MKKYGLKALTKLKNANDATITVRTQNNTIKKTFDKMFTVTLNFVLYKHLFILMYLKKIRL